MSAAIKVECGVECGKDLKLDMSGLEDKEEFDPAASVVKSYCKQITEDEFEEQGASETEKALEVDYEIFSFDQLCLIIYCGHSKDQSALFELRHEKTGFLHMQKQRRRSASR